jgi:uncharacterized Zn finger protein
MNITCKNCNEKFTPKGKLEKFINESLDKGMKFMMIECPKCGRNFPFKPAEMEESIQVESEIPLRCPIHGCSGLVAFIGEESFYGCGECGSVWKEQKNLFRDIEKSISIYPYRSKVYDKINDKYIAIDSSKEPKDYEKKVSKESSEELNSFERD